jgi:anti-sigma B factor antagonist
VSRADRQVCSLCLSYSEEFVMSNVMDDTNRFGYLEIRTERNGDEQVIALDGELDLDGAERVDRELLRAEGGDARRIVLDLSALRFIDSTGIRLILAADARSRSDGDRLVLIRGPRAVQRVFELTGIAERLPFEE